MPAPAIPVVFLVALLVTLIPTTIGGLLSAIGIAGMDRLVQGERHRQVRPRGRGGGRRRHAAARQDRHDHLRQPHGRCLRAAARRRPSASWPRRRCSPRSSDETPEGKSIVDAGPQKAWRIARPRARRSRAFIPFTARRASPASTSTDGSMVRKGAVDAVLRWCDGGEPARDAQARSSSAIARSGGTPLAGRPRRRPARRHPPQGHRQAGHPRALRGAAPDGHPHRDDHRRQPADRGRHRRRGRRRRLPRRGDAGEEARADPRRAGRRAPRRDVRRRHQRRAGARPGRRRRRDEQRHAGGQGSRQPDRPRQRSRPS